MSRAGTGWAAAALASDAVARRAGRSWRARPRGSSPPLRSRARPTARPRPPRAWCAPPRRSGAWARRNAACSASRRCPGCRSASRRPGACTTRTRFQSASSSSATIMGMPVRTPCPISDRWQTMVTMPSSRDGDEYERVVHPAIGHAVGAVLRRIGGAHGGREAGREHEAPRARSHPGGSAGGSRWRARGRVGRDSGRGALIARAPGWLATCLIASRIRTYVPQRQILPLMASSISASVGFGLRLSSAVADMICPVWQ